MEICLLSLRWCAVLVAAFYFGKLMSRIKMPAILGWLIAGMLFGPFGFGMLPQNVLDNPVYKIIITWMQCAFGLMLGTELVWSRIHQYGWALIITTLTQSLGTFLIVSCAFAIPMMMAGYPYMAGACLWQYRTCNSSGPGALDCTRVSYGWSGNRNLAADGGTG